MPVAEPAWTAAVRDVAGGAALDVEVMPGARESRFPSGFNEWRRRLSARVAAPPEDGRANEELARIVALALGVPAAQVTLTAGATSRQKTLFVSGLRAAEVVRRLDGHV